MSYFGKVTVMRKVLIGLLLAGAAATPALAGPHKWSNDQQQSQSDNHNNRQQAREERQQARQDAREERSNNRPSFNAQRFEQQPQQQRQVIDRSQFDRNERMANRDAERAQRDAYQAQRNAYSAQQRDERLDQMRERMDQRQQYARDARELRQSNRPTPNVIRDRHPLVVSNTPRPGTQPPLRAEGYRGHPQVQWSTNWRNNNRYDWHNYRHHHRSLFHLGFYFDPYGWGYQPYSIGWRLWPSYYSSRYWINDPWMYRLPYAPPGYVWVRYWNDALLVDTWSGEVVDSIPGFFW
jgi:hypothetical protein